MNRQLNIENQQKRRSSSLLNDRLRIHQTFQSIFCRYGFHLHHMHIYGGPLQNLWLQYFAVAALRDTLTHSLEHTIKTCTKPANAIRVFLFVTNAKMEVESYDLPILTEKTQRPDMRMNNELF